MTCPAPHSGLQRFAFVHDWSEITSIEFSPDGRFLAGLNDHEHLIVWEIATGEERLNRKLENWSVSGSALTTSTSSLRAVGSRQKG